MPELYQWRCGYCGISEVDAGGELTIDHYHPVSAGGDDTEENLVYACFRCNLYKGDYWTSSEDVLRVLHPLRDNLESHYKFNPATGALEPLSETGRFHISLLRLNRPELIAARLRRQIARASEEQIHLLTARVEQLIEILNATRVYARMLELALGVKPTSTQNSLAETSDDT